MTRALLLIPGVVKDDIGPEVAADRHPSMDYHALAAALRTRAGMEADVLDYADADADTSPGVRLARRLGGRDAALAVMALARRRRYDVVFTNGENVGIPLALLLGALPRRLGHVTIGHRLSTPKKQFFFRVLRAQRRLDKVFVYAQTQHDWAVDRLGVGPEKLALIPFQADDRFYRPLAVPVNPDQVCSVGREGRDYPTLLEAVAGMPDLTLKLTTASPWSRRRDETQGRALPPNVDARSYDYPGLRALYAESLCAAVPLYDTDFQAGITTVLEAMAMGKAVVSTRTAGLADVIADGENGLLVAPGDVEGWRAAITRLRADPALRERLGRSARRWVEENATLDRWAARLCDALARTAETFRQEPPENVPVGMNHAGRIGVDDAEGLRRCARE